MTEISTEQIRNFRLRSHHLDACYGKADILRAVGACGMQNSPPGAWETALYNRVSACTQAEMEQLLYQDKSLVQAWSLRGAPVVFPVQDSGVFLTALIPEGGEPWIYTNGITLALDYLQMRFDELLTYMEQVTPQLDHSVVNSKTTLDQTLAQWMLSLLPEDIQERWNHPSMYGSPDKQTVGGAVVSFLLRPCAFKGLVVFGQRQESSPTFTSYKNWTGHSLQPGQEPVKQLVRRYLHCYGPSRSDAFAAWLGCSGKQARRMWNTVSEEMEPVTTLEKKAFILSADKEALLSPEPLQRELLLLGGHDPYLEQRDRTILQPDKTLHKHIWKMVANPGAIVHRGEIVGIWNSKKKGGILDVSMTLWSDPPERQRLYDLAAKQKLYGLVEEYTAFRQVKLGKVTVGVL